jgi:hypothetical protein
MVISYLKKEWDINNLLDMNNKEVEDLFSLSFKYLNEILKDNDLQKELKQLCGNINIEFIKKSINYIYYNKDKRLNNLYKIKIDIEVGEKNIGYYDLYLDNDRVFIDEFFIIH